MGTPRFTLRFARSKEGSPEDQKANGIHNSSSTIPGAAVGSPRHPVAEGRRGRRETRRPTGYTAPPAPSRERLWEARDILWPKGEGVAGKPEGQRDARFFRGRPGSGCGEPETFCGRRERGSPGDQKANGIHSSSSAIPGAVVGSPGHPVAEERRGRRQTARPTASTILPTTSRERLRRSRKIIWPKGEGVAEEPGSQTDARFFRGRPGNGCREHGMSSGRREKASPADRKANGMHDSSKTVPGMGLGSPGLPLGEEREGRRHNGKQTGCAIRVGKWRERRCEPRI